MEIEHVTDTILEASSDPAASGAIPTAKPATPQISYVSIPLDQYSLTGIVRVRVWVDPWPAPITFYCELVLDGVSQGVKAITNPGASDFYYYFGDYDPLVNHNIEVYIWASDSGYSFAAYPSTTKAWFLTGTVSLAEKIVWRKREKKVSAMLFSADSTVDTSNLYVDITQVSDLNLWWSGTDIILKGTDFYESGDAELIYQLIIVT